MSRKRNLEQRELKYLAENLSDIESAADPFEDSGSEYIESEHSSSDSDIIVPKKFRIKKKVELPQSNPEDNSIDENQSHSDISSDSGSDGEEADATTSTSLSASNKKSDVVVWEELEDNFIPRMKIPDVEPCTILVDLNRGSSE